MAVTVLVICLLALVMPTAGLAGSARMELPMAPDLVAEADYWPGEADMPAILIMHGFLQTREFPTVRRLAESLAEEGFSVLTPTLTLGLNRRKQSLACEAVHTHSLQQDVAELTAWTLWLAKHAGKPPVVVGHSTGGMLLAAMLESGGEGVIRRGVLVSMVPFDWLPEGETLPILRQRVVGSLEEAGDEIDVYSLGYCRKYVTTAAALQSYLEWDRDRLERALIGAQVPVTVIFGDKDEQVDRSELDSLAAGGIEVRAVAGADHFFDLAHEFDLLEEVMRVVKESDNG